MHHKNWGVTCPAQSLPLPHLRGYPPLRGWVLAFKVGQSSLIATTVKIGVDKVVRLASAQHPHLRGAASRKCPPFAPRGGLFAFKVVPLNQLRLLVGETQLRLCDRNAIKVTRAKIN
jgi:hypothetical protein